MTSPPSFQLLLILNGNRVAHLALHREYQHDLLERDTYHYNMPPLVPSILHPIAALSFSSILRKLRSILCVVGFRGSSRAPCEMMVLPHFAQTYPLRRGGSPTGAFEWFESDPRLGVQLDLTWVALSFDPRCLAPAWAKLEKAFGVERTATSTDDDDHPSFYICPSMSWRRRQVLGIGAQGPPGGSSEGSREELAEHLRQEAKDWDHYRSWLFTAFGWEIKRHGVLDAETFERMERAPSTAVGMWLFRADAFKEPRQTSRSCFDLSAAQPGLFLFEC